MLITTHALATIAVGEALGAQTPQSWFLAFLFGVFIDLDHLKIFKPQYRKNGDWKKFFDHRLPMRSFLQDPLSIFWVVPLSFYLKTPIPMAAWSVHVFMDYLVDGCRKPFWPFSNFTLKKGILPNLSLLEFLLIPVSLFFLTAIR